MLSGLLGAAGDKTKQEGAEEQTGQDAAKTQSCILGQEIRTALHEVLDSPHDNNEVLTQQLGISGKAGSGAKFVLKGRGQFAWRLVHVQRLNTAVRKS